MPSIAISIFFFVFFFLLYLSIQIQPCLAHKPHKVIFRSPNLFPESAAWDAAAQHFLLGSTRSPSLHVVSDAGVAHLLLSDADLPPSAAFLGVAADPARSRLLAVAASLGRPPFLNALAAYDANSGRRLFLATLGDGDRGWANGLALDPSGNAFVTCSVKNLIWKVGIGGDVAVFSKAEIFEPTGVIE